MASHVREILWSAPGHLVARWDQIVVQVRTGEMTGDHLTQMETLLKLERAKADRSKKRGAILIAGAGAPPPRWEIVRRQQQLIRETLVDPLLYLGAVIETDTVAAMAQRGFFRLVLSSKQRGLFPSVAVAARFLEEAMDHSFDSKELIAHVAKLRAAM